MTQEELNRLRDTAKDVSVVLAPGSTGTQNMLRNMFMEFFDKTLEQFVVMNLVEAPGLRVTPKDDHCDNCVTHKCSDCSGEICGFCINPFYNSDVAHEA